jgi:hypothetical protein
VSRVRTHALLLGALAWAGIAAAAPDLSGFWQPDVKVNALRTRDDAAPPLLPSMQPLYASRLAAAQSGDRAFDNELQCRPAGIPRLMAESPFELVQTDREFAFLYEWNRLQRVVEVRTQHNAFDHAYPYYLGHPIASWRGNTLVIDSIYFNTDTVLDASGLPHSDALHVTERLQLQEPNTLQDLISIEDPKTFTRPWETLLVFHRMPPGTHFPEDVCVQRLGLKDLNSKRPKN